ncbi:MAG: signal peptidase II [Myxococcales bacterium]|nr:signal peptidase II [Myxococcales bacterium]
MSDLRPFQPRAAHLILACVLATLAFTVADLATKAWALEELSRERVGEPPALCENQGFQRIRSSPIVLVDGYLELQYAENCGAAFGILSDASPGARATIFGVAALGAILVLFWMFASGRGGKFFAYSVPLIVSGAIGNLHDRFQYGYVVDFIRAHWQDAAEWPTFNIADATITIGIVLMLIDGFIDGARARAAGEQPAP